MLTIDNPGSFNPSSKITLRSYLSSLRSKIINGNFKEIKFYLNLQTINYFNQLRTKPRYYCSCCKNELPYLIHKFSKRDKSLNSSCPVCNSRKRHRGLFQLYSNQFLDRRRLKILHFAPEVVFKNIFNGHDYYTTDYLIEDVNYPNEDIQNLSFEDCQFDTILCNHVLEHIKNDLLAVSEIHRILTIGGFAIITVPGDWNKERNHYFSDLSNNGHYRHYGMEFSKILQAHFEVEIFDLYNYNNTYKYPLGLEKNKDLAFICKKA